MSTDVAVIQDIVNRLDRLEKTVFRNGKTKKSVTGKKPRSATGPSLLIDRLIKEDFFNEKRTLQDCQKKVREWGYSLSPSDVAVVLLRKIRAGRGGLKRESARDGYVYFI